MTYREWKDKQFPAFKRRLQKAGWEVYWARTGTGAVQLFRVRPVGGVGFLVGHNENWEQLVASIEGST